ncbi:unnamed protein product [Closterium sp. NIES-65]|nr:unnamed protein product [Closterium sp. NIES-65]
MRCKPLALFPPLLHPLSRPPPLRARMAGDRHVPPLRRHQAAQGQAGGRVPFKADTSHVIDTFHRFAGIERLKDKPVGEFRDDQWLLIAKAESQGLVKVELGLPPAVVQENVIQGDGGQAKPVGEFRDDQWLLIAKAEAQGLVQVELGLPPAVVQENVIQGDGGHSVGEFRDDQWLLIAKAESQGLVQVELGLPPTVELEAAYLSDGISHVASLIACQPAFAHFLHPGSPPFPQEFEAAYLSDGVSHFASLWNEQRRTILRAAIAARLLPTMHKETRLLLTGRAKAFVAEQCALALWKHVSVAPFDVRAKGAGGGGGGGMGGGGGGGMRGGGGRGGRHGGGEEHGGGGQPWLRVMACCWGPGNPATTFAMLNAAGEMVDFLHTGFLWGGGGGEQQVMVMKKREDERRLMAFVKEHKPHVVVVGGANLACERLKDEIWEVIFKIVEHFPRDLTSDVDNVRVVFQDETLALLYENSAISQEHLPSQPGIVRRTVGLGRYMQNRLALAACLFGPAREVLSAKFHRSQDLLPPDDVYDALERVMVTVTNQVGVDVNYAAQEAQDWLFAPLQFVCGLGPRKASTLKVRILGEGVVRRRKDLIDPPFLLDQVVFINAAAFIRVRGQDDMLDDSRIHPADYRLALKVATDGYCEAHRGMTPHSVEERGIDVVLEARDNPDLIRRLDFEDYAVMLARKGQGGLKEKLLLIRRELMHGFAECRVQFESLNADEQFWLLSGETEESLAVGKVVTATVKRVLKFKVLCALESGVLGEVDRRDFSDDPNVELRDVVSEGQPLTCRIKEVKTEEAKVILTCKGSDLRSSEWREMRQWDPYYQRAAVEQEEQAATEERKRKEEEKRKNSLPPPHDHLPRSSTMCRWKALRRAAKDRTSATSFLRLGRTLTIGDESYEDLDEVSRGEGWRLDGVKRRSCPCLSSAAPSLIFASFLFLITYSSLPDHLSLSYVPSLFTPSHSSQPLAPPLRTSPWQRACGTWRHTASSASDPKATWDALVRTDKEREPARIPYYLSLSHDHPGAFMLTYIRSASVSGRPVHEYITAGSGGWGAVGGRRWEKLGWGGGAWSAGGGGEQGGGKCGNLGMVVGVGAECKVVGVAREGEEGDGELGGGGGGVGRRVGSCRG